MLFKRITKLVLLGAAVLLSTAVAQAQEPTRIDECTRIITPGSYLVVNDLPGPAGLIEGGNCLVVAVDFVTIDLGGFVLSGDKNGNGIDDTSDRLRSIVVRNGTVTKFKTAVNLNSTTESVVEGIQAVFNDKDGIQVRTGCRVTGNGASRTKGRGIVVTQGDCLVTDNVANENDKEGMEILGRGNTVDGNIANNNDRRGIVVECPSLVKDNTTVDNGTARGLRTIGSDCIKKNNLSG